MVRSVSGDVATKPEPYEVSWPAPRNVAPDAGLARRGLRGARGGDNHGDASRRWVALGSQRIASAAPPERSLLFGRD